MIKKGLSVIQNQIKFLAMVFQIPLPREIRDYQSKEELLTDLELAICELEIKLEQTKSKLQEK